MSNRKHVTNRHKSLIKFVFRSLSLIRVPLGSVCSPNLWQDQSTLVFPLFVETNKKTKMLYMYKTKLKKFFTFELVVMVGSALNGGVSLAVCMCVRVCKWVSWDLNGQYTHMSTFTHRIMGGSKLLRPHPPTGKETPVRSCVTCDQLSCGHLPACSDDLLRAAFEIHPQRQILSPLLYALDMLL